MAKKKNSNSPAAKPAPKRPIEILFDAYASNYQPGANKFIYWICIPLMTFGLWGLVWVIPFPHLKFMGQYAAYFNWASILLAAAVYYYYRLSPMLSYFMLLLFFLFSYGVTDLAGWQNAGGPPMGLVCVLLFALSVAGQVFITRVNGKKPSFIQFLQFLVLAPVWILHFLLDRLSMRY